MKVVSVEPPHGETVKILHLHGGTTEYVRFSADVWYEWTDDGLEAIYMSRDQCEAAYQAWQVGR